MELLQRLRQTLLSINPLITSDEDEEIICELLQILCRLRRNYEQTQRKREKTACGIAS